LFRKTMFEVTHLKIVFLTFRTQQKKGLLV
jgi:hypothetical protein